MVVAKRRQSASPEWGMNRILRDQGPSRSDADKGMPSLFSHSLAKVALRDVHRRPAGDNLSAAKCLGLQLSALGTSLQQGVKQRRHGPVSAQQRVGRIAAAPDRRQHEMIQAADSRQRVEQADRDAGSEQCRQRLGRADRPAARVDIACALLDFPGGESPVIHGRSTKAVSRLDA